MSLKLPQNSLKFFSITLGLKVPVEILGALQITDEYKMFHAHSCSSKKFKKQANKQKTYELCGSIRIP